MLAMCSSSVYPANPICYPTSIATTVSWLPFIWIPSSEWTVLMSHCRSAAPSWPVTPGLRAEMFRAWLQHLLQGPLSFVPDIFITLCVLKG